MCMYMYMYMYMYMCMYVHVHMHTQIRHCSSSSSAMFDTQLVAGRRHVGGSTRERCMPSSYAGSPGTGTSSL